MILKTKWILCLILPLLVIVAAGCGKTPNSQDSIKSFMDACIGGRPQEVADALEQGLDPNVTFLQSSGLIMAAMRCDFHPSEAEKITGLLLDAGADPNLKNKDGNTAIGWAVNGCCLGMIGKLINGGANLNEENSRQRTPLMIAAESNCVEGFKMLLDAGADPEYVSTEDVSVRELATASSDPKILEYLEQAQQE